MSPETKTEKNFIENGLYDMYLSTDGLSPLVSFLDIFVFYSKNSPSKLSSSALRPLFFSFVTQTFLVMDTFTEIAVHMIIHVKDNFAAGDNSKARGVHLGGRGGSRSHGGEHARQDLHDIVHVPIGPRLCLQQDDSIEG